MASHMDGINALPRWDPSNPTKYSYDPTNYNAADYEAFKQARLAFGQQQMKATAARNEKIFKEANKVLRDAINNELKKQGPTRGEIQKAAKAGKRLIANTPSSCFASLEWHKGIATAEFYRGGQIVYDYPMSLDEFLDWAQDDSLGEYFNAEIR
jgi:ABC-type uncharacterized transport system substrate-binding protein